MSHRSATQMGQHTQTNLTLARGAVLPKLDGYAERDIAGAVNNEDVWRGVEAIQPEPDLAGYSLWVESSSDNDGAGTDVGVSIVEAHYLDVNGAQQNVSVNMNGLTPVNTGVTDCMFVNEFHAKAVGSNLVAVGNIDATQGSGGTVVSRIAATENYALSAMRMVPASKNLYVSSWHAVGTAVTTKEARIRLRTSSHELDVHRGVYLFKDSTRVKDSASGTLMFDPPLIIPALATIKISAWTTGIINVSAAWHGWLEDNF